MRFKFICEISYYLLNTSNNQNTYAKKEDANYY